jgi:hypothetical protein
MAVASDTMRGTGPVSAEALRFGPRAARVEGVLSLLVSAFGLAMRWYHAQTFHSEGRAADYETTISAIRWVIAHRTTFDVGDQLHNGYHGPLWYVIAALVLATGHPIRAIAFVSVAAYAIRQAVLWAAMRRAAPDRPDARFLALALHAVLPVAVYQDGLVYNEALHATLFTLALFFLWRIERDGDAGVREVKTTHAALFGLFAGLDVLTKASATILVFAALALIAAWLVRGGPDAWTDTLRALVRPVGVAALVMLAVAGWYCINNLVKFGHPLPHEYMVKRADVIAQHPIVAEPLLYHRPAGWFLPFEFEYWDEPFAPWSRPNFWSQMISGTWVDDINRGFCRMHGGGPARPIWRRITPMSLRCIAASVVLVRVGLAITIAAVVGCFASLRSYRRSRGRRGSLVVPVATVLSVALLMWFGTMYPFDHHPVIKAAYALHAAPALCAFYAFAITNAKGPPWLQRTAIALGSSAVVIVGVLVAGELWWI